MREDNTPTVTARRRKPTPHQRLRLEKARKLKALGALTHKKRTVGKVQNPGETDPEKMVAIAPRVPKLKKDTLAKPEKSPARFRKRQVHKQWLPTHLYHAKRAHMTPPKEPLWRFAIPLTPTDKCYRPTHRATSLRGAVAWDTSYVGTIGIEGVEASVLGLLKSIGIEENILTGKKEAKWRRGTRGLEGWIKERDGERRSIAKVMIVWCFRPPPVEVEDAARQEKGLEKHADSAPQEEGDPTLEMNTEKGPGPKIAAEQAKEKVKRRLLLRVHPSAFFQVWNELLKVAKIQRPQVMLEDLRFEVGSIEILGPGSTEALIGALHPKGVTESTTEKAAKGGSEREWVDIGSVEEVWPQLAAVTNPACLPANAMLGFNISDPRLHYPPRTVSQLSHETVNETLLDLLSSWPPDQTQTTPDMFDRTKRLTASRQLASQKAINRRKGEALPGAYPEPNFKDPKIPVLLLASRPRTKSGQGTWTLLLPWDCVLPVWYSLMHYPLSTGGNPRLGGLQEKRQVSFEQGVPWFPGDYPGTKAGYQWELMERERKKQDWERRPKGKKTEWDRVDLGERRGEIGLGWACDWDRLFQGLPSMESVGDANKTSAAGQERSTKDRAKPAQPPPDQQPEQPPIETPDPPLNIHHLLNPVSITQSIPPTALSPVHITLISTGHPTPNARIYRLPNRNPELRARWLALANPPKGSNGTRNARPRPPPPKDMPQRARAAQTLASSLLSGSNSGIALRQTTTADVAPKAGDNDYPPVPDEVDLIGFVTTANYDLGQGRCEAIGNVAVARVLGNVGADHGNEGDDDGKNKNKKKEMASAARKARDLCIVREAGQGLGRLARWRFVE